MRSTANSSRGTAWICFLYVELTLSHHWRAWLFRSPQLGNVRPARKLFSMKENGRSTRAERLALPIWCATKRNPKRSANASLSGTAIISRPVPRNTTTCVLSIITRWDFHSVRRRIVLHLHARLEVILARGHDRRLSDALPAAEARQRLIGHRRAARLEFLMDSHEIPLARCQKIEDLFAVRFRFLRPLDLRQPGAGRRDAGWQSPSADRAPLVRPPRAGLPTPASAFSKTV